MLTAPIASIVPVGNRVLLRTEKPSERTKNGIHLPQVGNARTTLGVILALGDEVDMGGIDVGVSVVFSPYSGVEVEIGDEKALILGVGDIIAIANREPFEV